MKKMIAICLVLVLVMSLAACGNSVGNAEIYAFPEPPTEISVTLYATGTEVTYSLAEFNSIMNWFYNLKLVEMSKEPELAEGSELFAISVDGKEVFSYENRGNEAYLHMNDKIYEVKNPSNPPYDETRHMFNATIIEISDSYFLVEPLESMLELNSADRFQVPMKHMDASPEPEIGDILEIVYNGEFQETYPAIITEIHSIRVIDQATAEAPNALVPSIMYNGEIYRTTGRHIPAEVEEDAYAGKIISTVPISQWPREEGQANFGEIGTPYAVTSEGFVVLMNNEWTVFEAIDNIKHTFQGNWKTYYEMTDGTWLCDDIFYEHRLEIRGRLNQAACDTTFVYLSNVDISFEQAWKAAGLSSNLNDYFSPEEAVLVEMRTEP